MTSKNILLVLSLFVLVVLISARDIHESSSNSKADDMNGGTNNGLNKKSESDCTDQDGGLGGCKWGYGWSWGTPGGGGWGWGYGGPLPAPSGGSGGAAPPPLGGVQGGPLGGGSIGETPSSGSSGGGSGDGSGYGGGPAPLNRHI